MIQDSADEQYQDNVIQSIGFSPCGRFIVTSDVGNSVCLWDLEKNLARQRLRHTDSVYAACFSPNGKLVASVTGNGQLVLWDSTGELVTTFEGYKGGFTTVAFRSNGIIATGDGKGTIRFWQADWKQWLKVCCDRLHHDPVFTNPESIEDLEQREIAIAACKTCEKYVWNKAPNSVE